MRRRHKISILNSELDSASEYGQFALPNDRTFTLLIAHYASVEQALKKTLKEGKYEKFIDIQRDGRSPVYQLKAPFIVPGFSNDPPSPHSRIDLNNYRGPLVSHTSDPLIKKQILDRIEALCALSIAEKSDRQFLRCMGLVFWWFCQAKFLKYGDPSVAEGLIRCSCPRRGLDLPQMEGGRSALDRGYESIAIRRSLRIGSRVFLIFLGLSDLRVGNCQPCRFRESTWRGSSYPRP